METPSDAPVGVYARVRASDIESGDNPRPESEIDPAFITELAASFKALGRMLQRPLVQDLGNGKYRIVDGECRTRGWRQAFGEDAEMDVETTEIEDKAWLDAASTTANVIRRAMSPLAEAEGAARMLGHCNGDRDDAAKRLGWSRPTLDSRLALMYAVPAVRQALRDKKILLGHAELLAVLRKEVQDKGLELLLGRDMSVAAFKAHLERAALVLDTAIFEKTECAGCHHNTSNQGALFAETISGGKCSNKACFDDKTEAALNLKVATLRDEFQNVRIARAGENFTIINLVADGAKGVGAAQAQACKLCKNFGGVVSAVPDKLGMVYTNICMDVPCNTKMVAARINAEKSTSKAAEKPAISGSPTGTGAKAARPNSASAKAGRLELKYPEPSNRVKEYREKVWRAVYQRAVAALDVPSNRAVLLALMLTNPSVIDHDALAEAMKELIPAGSKPSNVATALSMAREFKSEQLSSALKYIAASAKAHSLPIDDVVAVLKSFEVKLSDFWKVKKEFFDLLTKNEIDAVCTELGIVAAMGGQYAKARALGKDDYIKAILAVDGFEYHGRIPMLVRW